MTETASAICAAGAHLVARGLAPGTSGNVSARVDDGFLMTPTNAALGTLTPERLARLGADGRRLEGPVETKERELHLQLYRERPDARAIVHVHSTHAVALACLDHPDPSDVLLPLTPYAVMRVGRLALAPYAKPGSQRLAELVRIHARTHAAILLANHGPIVAAATLDAAVAIVEEIEEAAKLQLLLHGRAVRMLGPHDVAELQSA